VPGFAVFFVGVAGIAGAHAYRAVAQSDGGGNDVPDVFGNDVDGEELEVGELVGLAFPRAQRGEEGRAASGTVSGTDTAVSGFHLHADEAVAEIDDDVVAGGLAEGFVEVEAVSCGLGHEAELGPLAALFRISDFCAITFQKSPLGTS